jgi:hypothetical protein
MTPEHKNKDDLASVDHVESIHYADIETLEPKKSDAVVDPVFGEITDSGPNYRNVCSTTFSVRGVY